MKNLKRFGEQALTKLKDPVGVPEVVARQGEHPKVPPSRHSLEGAAFGTDDQLFVAAISKSAGKAQQLPLSAP